MAATEFANLSLYNDANLQEYYKLEDLTGKNGNTLTNNNSATFVAAKFNNGVSGGSSDGNKSLSVASALGYANGAYGISLWAKMNTEIASGNYDLMEISEATTDTSLIITYDYNAGTRRLQFTHLRAGVAADQINHTITLGTTDFYHIVFTSTGNGGTLKGYINNVATATATHVGTAGSGLANKTVILEGRTANNNSTLGIIDDVALFNRELTVADVDLIYNGPPSAAGNSSSFLFNFV